MAESSLSVKVIIHDDQGRVLLLQRVPETSRHNAGKWEFPGGKVDAGENFEQSSRLRAKCMKRRGWRSTSSEASASARPGAQRRRWFIW